MVSREIPASTNLPDLFLLLDLLLCTHRHTWSLELGKHGGLVWTLLRGRVRACGGGASARPACWLAGACGRIAQTLPALKGLYVFPLWAQERSTPCGCLPL